MWLNLGYVGLAFVLAFSGLAQAQDSETTWPERRDKFRLFNHCGPMDLGVDEISADAREIGLTKYSLRAAVESRLRSARLFDESASSFLAVEVNVVGADFSVDLSFSKTVCDVGASNECWSARTWYRGSVGTHGKNGNHILSSVSRHMDHFILEYLRVNEEACSLEKSGN